MNATTGSETKNHMRLDCGSSAPLKDFFSRLPDGEKFKIEIEGIKIGMTGDALESHVESVSVDGMEENSKAPLDAKPGGEVEPSAEEPVSILIGKAAGY